MLLAKLVAVRSTCIRRKVGAVVVRDKRILATGYNGQLPGLVHCGDESCKGCEHFDWCMTHSDRPASCRILRYGSAGYIPCAKARASSLGRPNPAHYCRAIHAGANAVLQAAKVGISLEGADLYCTLKPCPDCIKLIASAGIKRVFYELDYYDDKAPELVRFWEEEAKEAGLEFVQLSVSEEALNTAFEVLKGETSRRKGDVAY